MSREKKEKKRKKAWKPLIFIPIQGIIDVIVLAIAGHADSAIADPNATGHPAPAFTLLAAIALSIITIIVVILCCVIAINRARENRIARKAEKAAGGVNPGVPSPIPHEKDVVGAYDTSGGNNGDL